MSGVMMAEIAVRNWRITRAEPDGAHVWFDPTREAIQLYRLLPHDGEVVDSSFVDVDGGGGVR